MWGQGKTFDLVDSNLEIADVTPTFGLFVKYLVANISTAVPLPGKFLLHHFICVDFLV